MGKTKVVRCKNCEYAKWSDNGWWIYCTYGIEFQGSNEMDEEFYCGYGEYDEGKEAEQYRNL